MLNNYVKESFAIVIIDIRVEFVCEGRKVQNFRIAPSESEGGEIGFEALSELLWRKKCLF